MTASLSSMANPTQATAALVPRKFLTATICLYCLHSMCIYLYYRNRKRFICPQRQNEICLGIFQKLKKTSLPGINPNVYLRCCNLIWQSTVTCLKL
ncbi:hypothetical protein AFLA_008261 [Aspergillus flavus NRRL3357]|nr:hypothetical protein AFLA_008261 [Aspergillus flavus NRRL3357]